MALIKCKECGKSISSEALSCPHCGKSTGSLLIKALIVVAAVITGFVLAIIYFLIVKINDNASMAETVTPQKTVNVQPPARPASPAAPPPAASSTWTVPIKIDETAPAEKTVQTVKQNWVYENTIDPMSSQVTHFAWVESENFLSFDFPYAGEQQGILTLREHPKYGLDVMMTIEKGQILCQSYRDCQVTVRFDEEESMTWSAVGPEDNSSRSLFLRRPEDFLNRLKKSKKVAIQFTVYHGGNPVLIFPVSELHDLQWRGRPKK